MGSGPLACRSRRLGGVSPADAFAGALEAYRTQLAALAADQGKLTAVAAERTAGARGLVPVETWLPEADAQSHTFADLTPYRAFQLRFFNVGSSATFEQMHLWPDDDILTGKWRYAGSGVVVPSTGKVRVVDDSGAAQSGPVTGVIDIVPVSGPAGRMAVLPRYGMFGLSDGYRPLVGEMAKPTTSLTFEGRAATSFPGGSARVELWGERA